MSKPPPVAGIILAAGKGTRMKSDYPKGLHPVCGLPMVEYIGRAMRGAGVEKPVVVIGHNGDLLRGQLGEQDYAYAYQKEQLGTGHAALMAKDAFDGFRGPLILTPGDTPLLTSESLETLYSQHIAMGSDCTLATINLENPKGYGRVVRNKAGDVISIVEERDATDREKKITEVCTSIYCFNSEKLFQLLPRLKNVNKVGEYYLTEIVSLIAEQGGRSGSVIFDDPTIMVGVNDRWQLAEASETMRRRILKRHALNGVTIEDTATIFIGANVQIDPDTTIAPMTVIEGNTRIGAGCIIGPMSRVTDCQIAEECVVLMSHLNNAVMLEASRCGPYANLRPGTVLGERARVGNFVEVKNATLGEQVSASHLSYIGDATVGSNTNIGAGTITCNYDGFRKHITDIGKDAFVGSNSTLVAPVRIGDGAIIGAGSVITADVPDDALGIGRARQEVKEKWASQWRQRNRTHPESK